MSNLTGMNAKDYEVLGKKIHIQDTPETLKLLEKESYAAMKQALKKDGTTGFLSDDKQSEVVDSYNHRGYFCEVFKSAEGFMAFAKEIEPLIIGGSRKSFETVFFGSQHAAGGMINAVIDATRGIKS
jgi:hypothetical protein